MLALLSGLAGVSAAAAVPLPDGLRIQGRVAHQQILTLTDLEQLPLTTISLTQASEHGPQQVTYGGVLLWTLLDRALLVDEPGRKTHLRHIILAQGADGYAVALGVGEVDPNFEGKQVIVALTRNGAPMHSLELAVPGDRHAGRNVHDLNVITVN